MKTILYQSSEDIKALDKQSYLNRHEVIIKILNPKDDVVYFGDLHIDWKIEKEDIDLSEYNKTFAADKKISGKG